MRQKVKIEGGPGRATVRSESDAMRDIPQLHKYPRHPKQLHILVEWALVCLKTNCCLYISKILVYIADAIYKDCFIKSLHL